MPVWVCECGCKCGICTGCECESHALDPLSDMELMWLLTFHGGMKQSDVYGKSRNALFRLMCTECDDPMTMLKHGTQVVKTKLKGSSSHVPTVEFDDLFGESNFESNGEQQQDPYDMDEVLQSVTRRSTTPSPSKWAKASTKRPPSRASPKRPIKKKKPVKRTSCNDDT